jgi:DNA-binding MarR family transcriptional regulator
VENASCETIMTLLKAAHALEDKLEATLADVGLSGPKFSVLNALVAAKEPMALGELADKLSCVKSNATQMIDRLEAEGLVRRISDAEDRRSVKAELTSSGRERHTAGAAKIAELEARFADAVESEDRSAVARMLRAIVSPD